MEILDDLISRDDILSHHGIKGQKHGVRRFQNPDGSWTAAGRLRYGKGSGDRSDRDDYRRARREERKASRDEKRAAKTKARSDKAEEKKLQKENEAVRSKSLRDLSDDEISKRIDRLNLEKKYKGLFNEVNPPVTTGMKAFVKKLILDTAKQSITDVSRKTTTYLLGNIVDSALGVKVNTGKVKKNDDKSDDD